MLYLLTKFLMIEQGGGQANKDAQKSIDKLIYAFYKITPEEQEVIESQLTSTAKPETIEVET